MGDHDGSGADLCGLVHTSTGPALLHGLEALLPPRRSVAYATPYPRTIDKGRTP